MSADNIPAFQDKVQSSPELQSRLDAIRRDAATPIAELSDQDLAPLAGGGNVIVKKEHLPDSAYNLWGFFGNAYRYTTDDGEPHRSGQNFEVGDTFTRPRRFSVK